ncbi:MAG: flippase-like domain-containing protein [Clostridium sp.]|nr:flippase-like domain-containing protein [Clostridium sp.]
MTPTKESNDRSAATAEPQKGRPSPWRAVLKYGVPLAISVGLCYLLFTGFDFREMMEIVRRDCDFRWFGAVIVVSIFSHIFRAMRWQIQLRALDVRPPLFYTILSIFGTYAVNLVLPRLGELWRTGYIASRQRASFTTVFGSMVADRLADTITVLLLTVATFLLAGNQLLSYLAQNQESYDRILAMLTSPGLWLGIAAVVAVIWAIFARFPENRVVAKIREIWNGLWKGFAVIASMPGRGRWLLLTVCIWGCYFLQLYLAFFAFPLTAEVATHYGIIAILVCFVLSSISMGVPSNGGIGPWQWAIIFGLGLYSAGIPGLTREYAASFANLVLGIQTLLLIILGLFTFICIAVDKRRNKPTTETNR